MPNGDPIAQSATSVVSQPVEKMKETIEGLATGVESQAPKSFDIQEYLKGLGINTGNLTAQRPASIPFPTPPMSARTGKEYPGLIYATPAGRTKAGTKRNAILGAISNVGTQLETYKRNKDERTARDTEYNLQRYLTAMSNPTPANKQLMQDMMDDPKIRKSIEKALDLDFLKPAGEASPENKALGNLITKAAQADQGGPSMQGQPSIQGGPSMQGQPSGQIPGGGTSVDVIQRGGPQGMPGGQGGPGMQGMPNASPQVIAQAAALRRPDAIRNARLGQPSVTGLNPQVEFIMAAMDKGLIPKTKEAGDWYNKQQEMIFGRQTSVLEKQITAVTDMSKEIYKAGAASQLEREKHDLRMKEIKSRVSGIAKALNPAQRATAISGALKSVQDTITDVGRQLQETEKELEAAPGQMWPGPSPAQSKVQVKLDRLLAQLGVLRQSQNSIQQMQIKNLSSLDVPGETTAEDLLKNFPPIE